MSEDRTRQPRNVMEAGDRANLLADLYPARSPEYKKFVETYHSSHNQAALRILLSEGWEEAREVVAAYQRNDMAWIRAWRANEPLPEPKENSDPDSELELPIPENNRPGTASSKTPYTVYLRRSNPAHAPIIKQHESYGEDRAGKALKQMFLRLAFVIASKKPGIEERILQVK